MSDSEKELFGDSPSVSDVEMQPVREPVHQSATLKRYPPTHPFREAYVSRIPAFLRFEPQPFDAAKYLQTEKTNDELAMEANSVRWTYAAAGADAEPGETVARVSNARIIEWEDGSRTLQLGNEHFSVKTHEQKEPTLVCTQHDELLAAQQLAYETMTFLPTSTSSATHLMLAKALQRKQDAKQIRVGSVKITEDPDRIQREIEKAEQQKEKARKKLDAQREETAVYTPQPMVSAELESEEDAAESEEESEAKEEESDEEAGERLSRIKRDEPMQRRKMLDDSD